MKLDRTDAFDGSLLIGLPDQVDLLADVEVGLARDVEHIARTGHLLRQPPLLPTHIHNLLAGAHLRDHHLRLVESFVLAHFLFHEVLHDPRVVRGAVLSIHAVQFFRVRHQLAGLARSICLGPAHLHLQLRVIHAVGGLVIGERAFSRHPSRIGLRLCGPPNSRLVSVLW